MLALRKLFSAGHVTFVTSGPHSVRTAVTAYQHLPSELDFTVFTLPLGGNVFGMARREARKLQKYARQQEQSQVA